MDEKSRHKLTWAEFKARVEALGVAESDEIDFIDVSWGEPEAVHCQKDEDFGWQISLDEGRLQS